MITITSLFALLLLLLLLSDCCCCCCCWATTTGTEAEKKKRVTNLSEKDSLEILDFIEEIRNDVKDYQQQILN